MDCVPPSGFTNWVKTSDPAGTGELVQNCTSTYITTDTANEAIARAQIMQPPWFLYVSFNSAHTPIHDPPLCLTRGTCATQYCPSVPTDPEQHRYNAMVEALDEEIGRMLAGIFAADPQAYIFLIGDNGTSGRGAQGAAGSCFDPLRSKFTLYEGGINVPLIVKGPGVVLGENTQLVNSTDLFATIARLARVNVSAEDSVSLAPYLFGSEANRRTFVYAERFQPNQATPDHPSTHPFNPTAHGRTIRDSRCKLIRFTDDTGAEDEELYDLEIDPCEMNDLCPGPGPCDPATLTAEQRIHYEALKAELISMGVY
jgi:arylsulfatase A-like enzyme